MAELRVRRRAVGQLTLRPAGGLAVFGVPGTAALRRRPFLVGAGLSRLPSNHGDHPQPRPHSTPGWLRHDRALALDRAADPGEPPWLSADVAALLPALAGRPACRRVLEPDLWPRRGAERPRHPGLPGSAADDPEVLSSSRKLSRQKALPQ